MRRKQTKGNKMDNVVDDLAGLGLNLDNAAPVDQVETPVEAKEDAVVARAPRTKVKLAEIKVETGFSLAPITRGVGFGGGRESKYKFDELAEPVNVAKKGEEPKWEYSTMLIAGEAGEDPKKVASSARAAVAAQNKKHKDAGETVRFVSRAEGANVRVYRVDGTISED
jgi:hypothetical protein